MWRTKYVIKTYHYRATYRQRQVTETFLLLVLLAGAFWHMRCSFHIPTWPVHLNVLTIVIQSLRLSCTINHLKICQVCRYIFLCIFSSLLAVAVIIQYCNAFDVYMSSTSVCYLCLPAENRHSLHKSVLNRQHWEDKLSASQCFVLRWR